jgi:hypothetical protein
LLVVLTACGTTSYEIPRSELRRLSQLPPADRGKDVRVVQQLTDADVGPEQPVTGDTQIVIFPDVYVAGGGGGGRGGYVTGGGHWGPHATPPGTGPGVGGGGHGGGGVAVGNSSSSGSTNNGAGDGKAEAIVLVAAAITAVVIAAAVEGSREDGYAAIHPMTPLYLTGLDGSQVMMPLAALDYDSAAFTRRAIIRSDETPFHFNRRADLDRRGFTYAVFGGAGTLQSADGTTASGPATTIQFGYFPEQHIGILSSLFFGWRDNDMAKTVYETRYTLEVDGYVVQAGPVHLGLYGGIGGASRLEDGYTNGNASSLALQGGALVQLDINTRLALTVRGGQTYAHGEAMTDILFGLSVY